MNEATLEARVSAEIQKHFTSIAALRITHQKYLTLRLGHNTDVQLDALKQEKINGRLDILLSFDEKPLAVLELKAPGEPLTEDDQKQGISYAKLLVPQAPLVILSNGEVSQFFQTHDAKEWNPSNKDDEAVKALFSHALSCAADERNEAIRLLLGKQPYLSIALFRKYTKAALIQLTGAIDDYTRPLTHDFIVERSIVSKIREFLINREPLVILTGPPLSGKTNVVAQMCRSDDDALICVYIDAMNASYGIFQHIATQFTREMYVPVVPGEVRQWLFNGVKSVPGHFAIIIDGWRTNIIGTLKEDIDELVNFLHPGQSISVLLSMDDTAFAEAKSVPGRPTASAIGRNAKIIQLDPLNDQEFKSTCKLIFEKYRAVFHHGAQINQDYRIPRILRLLCTVVSQSGIDLSKDKNKAKLLPSITNYLIFESWRKFIVNPEVQSLFQDLAKAYILR